MPLSEIHLKRKQAFFCKVLTAANNDAVKKITFQSGTLQVNQYMPRRVGRPKQRWAQTELARIWALVKMAQPHLMDFDSSDAAQQQVIVAHAETLLQDI